MTAASCIGHVLFVALISMVRSQCLSENDNATASISNRLAVDLLVQSSNHFGLDVYKEIYFQSPANVNPFISPISVWSAMIMVYIGSKTYTETELGQALDVSKLGKVTTARAYKTLKYWYYQRAKNLTSAYKLQLANRLYFQSGEPLRDCMQTYFRSELDKADFRNNTEEAVMKINKWIRKQTGGKIRDMLNLNSVNPFTRLVIANAAYFKGAWLYKFSPNNTKPDTFWVSANEQRTVQMMHNTGYFAYGVSEKIGCSILEVPYSGDHVSLYMLLPETVTIDELILKLSPEMVRNVSMSTWVKEVHVGIPKFRISFSAELTPILQTLGIEELFNPAYADLSGFLREEEILPHTEFTQTTTSEHPITEQPDLTTLHDVTTTPDHVQEVTSAQQFHSNSIQDALESELRSAPELPEVGPIITEPEMSESRTHEIAYIRARRELNESDSSARSQNPAGLFVNTIKHKAYIEVNEEGTEAAAATAVLTMRSARPAEPDSFIANRPFVFYVFDKLSGTVLFIGTVRDPTLQ